MKFIDIDKINPKEPLIADWALLRISYLNSIDKEMEEKFEESLFNKEIIDHLLENRDEDFLDRFIELLSPERFSDSIDLLIKKWHQFEGMAAYRAGTIIAEIAPDRACELFSSYMASFNQSDFHPNRTASIVDGLQYLEEERSRELSFNLLNRYFSNFLKNEFYDFYAGRLIVYAWEHKYPDFRKFFNLILKNSSKKASDICHMAFENLSLLFNTRDDYLHINNFYNQDNEQIYKTLFLLFNPDSPLEEVDKVIESLYDDNPYDTVLAFFHKNKHFIEDERVKDFLLEVLEDNKFLKNILDENRIYFYIFVISNVVCSMRKKEIKEEELTIENVINLLSSDISKMPFFNVFFEYLKKMDRNTVVNLLKEHLNKHESYWERHIIKMMGRLSYDEFISDLISLLDEEIYEEAEYALAEYGEKICDYIKREFNNISENGRYSSLRIMELTDKEKITDFIYEYFPLLFKNSKNLILRNILFYPEERFIVKLEPYINKNQINVDHTFFILNKLYRKNRPELKLLEESLLNKMENDKTIEKALDEGNIRELVPSSIDLELRCASCGDESIYKMEEVIVNGLKQEEGMEIIFKEPAACVNCGKGNGFIVTPKGRETIERESLKLFLYEISEKGKIKKYPLRVLDRTYDGKYFKLEEIIEIYKDKVIESPADCNNYIILGNIYSDILNYEEAENYYKKAIEKDPFYIEPYYCLGTIAFFRDDFKESFYWLNKGWSFTGSSKYSKEFDMDENEFLQSYMDIYNKMALVTGNKVLIDESVRRKTGRNDPCPCGSGKKYKKCCLR